MNEQSTKIVKGKKRTRVVVLATVLVLLLAVVSVYAAVAGTANSHAPEGTFKLHVAGLTDAYDELGNLIPPEGGWPVDNDEGAGIVAYDGHAEFSTTETVSLYSDTDDCLFSTDENGIYNVRKLVITIEGASLTPGSNDAIQCTVDNNGNLFSESRNITSTQVRIVATSKTAFSYNEINDLLGRVYLSFNHNQKKYTTGTPKVIVEGYNDATGSATSSLIDWVQFTCAVKFYTFAEASIQTNTLDVDYDNEDPTLTTLAPKDENRGTADFNILITNPGDSKEITVGHMVKKSNENWLNGNELLDPHTYVVSDLDLKQPLPIHVTGLNANTDYDVKVVVVSDGRYAAPKETESVSVRYEKPVINTFNIGDTEAAYIGGSSKEVTATIAFNNANYDGKTWLDEDKNDHFGPLLSVQLLFTDNLTSKDGKDTSNWSTSFGEKRFDYNDLNVDSRLVTHKFNTTLPSNKDGKTCAYKLVVTDLKTGFSAYAFSDPLLVDSTPPTPPQVEVKETTEGSLTGSLKDGTVIAGSDDLPVTIGVSGSTDAASGMQEYQYSMYYLSAEQGDGYLGEKNASLPAAQQKEISVQNVLQAMLDLTPDNYTTFEHQAEYTDWTSMKALDSEAEDPASEISVTRDGYYCLRVRSLDKVGKNSEQNTENEKTYALFRVDLTSPNAPDVRLATPKATKDGSGKITYSTITTNKATGALTSGEFEAYDDRTYSDREVWAFAKSIPLTGKTIQRDSYEYSLDSGLTWSPVKSEDTWFKDETGAKTVNVWKKDYTGKEDFQYDVAFKITTPDRQGYQTVMFRAMDSLGNQSPASENAIARHSKQIAAQGELGHTNIEIALAVGNTEMVVSNLSPEIKNAVAKRINERYYGDVTAASFAIQEGKSGYNPLVKLYTVESTNLDNNAANKAEIAKTPSKVAVENGSKLTVYALHLCTWENGTTCDQGAACPYATLGEQCELFTPDMVNFQSVQAANPNTDKSFVWTRYDHTQYNMIDKDGNPETTGDTIQIPTVGYISDRELITNLQPDKTKATYRNGADGEERYTATQDRVVWQNQKNVVTGNNLPDPNEPVYNPPTGSGNSSASVYTNFENNIKPVIGILDRYTLFGFADEAGGGYSIYNTFPPRGTTPIVNADRYVLSYKNDGLKGGDYMGFTGWGQKPEPYSAAGGFTGTIQSRVYHMVDMSQTDASGNPTPGNLNNEGTMNSINALGYSAGSPRDWLFLYSDQPTRKEISFTINDRSVYTHSNDGYGFFFNTTIRQNIAGKWVISGYMFHNGLYLHDKPATWYEWSIYKLTDVDLERFADGALWGAGEIPEIYYTGTAAEIFDLKYATDDLTSHLADNGPYPKNGGKIETIAFSKRDNGSVAANRHFKLITESANTTIYVYDTGNTVKTAAELDEVWAESQKNPPASSLDGYWEIQWQKSRTDTTPTELETPRPTVDGMTIGDAERLAQLAETQGDDLDPSEVAHMDSNCYGFGPYTSARLWEHACSGDTLVTFTNISMKMDKARSLSEVLTEPKWGGGKTRYVLNVTDMAVGDFKDAISSAEIEKRLKRENANLVTWGSALNRKSTEEFVDTRIDGNGFFMDTTASVHSHEQQADEIGDYVAKTYYKAYGIDLEVNSAPVKQQVQTVVSSDAGKGKVYSLEDAKKMTFSVAAMEDGVTDYNESSANDDYPSGRWFIIHDVSGYPTAQQDARDHQYSDSLNLKITQPGRYQIYFAPDQSKIDLKNKTDTLDPSDKSCIFDFIVNQPPETEIVGLVDKNTSKISIQDFSVDPDTNLTMSETKPGSAAFAADGTQLTGIQRTEWTWDMMLSFVDPETMKSENMLLMTQKDTQYGTSAGDPYTGKTVHDLTSKNVVVNEENIKRVYTAWKYDSTHETAAKPLNAYKYDELLSDLGITVTESGSNLTVNTSNVGATTIPNNVLITVNQRAVDVSTHREISPTTKKPVYVAVTGEKNQTSVSQVAQANLVSAELAKIVNPSSAMAVSTANMYNTATHVIPDDTVPDPVHNDEILITRSSTHPQGRNIAVSFELDYGSGWVGLTTTDGGATYTLAGEAEPALKVYTDKDGKVWKPTDNSPTGTGKWVMTKQFIKDVLGGKQDGELSLRIIETINDPEVTSVIKDQSARSIYYRYDTQAPSAQSVTLGTYTTADKGNTWVGPDPYEASNYMDVTQQDRKIVITVGGSIDAQGEVAGYGYYFYDRQDGKKNGEINSISYMKADGTLQKVTEDPNYHGGADLVKQRQYAVGLLDGSKRGVLPIEDGKIEITHKAKRYANKATDSLNVAIFAFDNRPAENPNTAAGNLTGRNETTLTRIEDIKLASFKPMPPEIKAVNSLGATVAYISNEKGFTGSIGSDTQTGVRLANSTVTLSFTPKSGVFYTDAAGNVEYKPNPPESWKTMEGYTSTYMDVTKQQDLTKSAIIHYSVRKDGSPYKPANSNTYWTNLQGDANTSVSINESGAFEVEAWVENGSHTLSDHRTISFTIDKEAPQGLALELTDDVTNDPYNGGWSKGVRVKISGAADAIDKNSYYRWSLDNGATWQDTSKQGAAGLNPVNFTLDKTGEYNIRVCAMDTAGNVSATKTAKVQIDRQAPRMSPPSIVAEAKPVARYSDYVISIQESVGGAVYAVNSESVVDWKSTEIAVKLNQNQSFIVVPEPGYSLVSVNCGGVEYVPGDMEETVDGPKFTVKGVTDNMDLTAQFVAAANYSLRSYMTASYHSSAQFRAASMEAETGLPASYSQPSAQATVDFSVVQLSMDGVVTPDRGSVDTNSSQRFVFTPDDGYRLDLSSVTIRYGDEEEATPIQPIPVDGVADQYEYTVDRPQKPFVITCNFVEKILHTLTIADVQGGKVSVVSGATANGDGTYSFYHNIADLKLSFTPDSSYVSAGWKLNGEVQTTDPIAGELLIPQSLTQGDLNIEGLFQVSGDADKAYVGVVIVGGNGHVTPQGTLVSEESGTATYKVEVPKSSTTTFTFYPDPGFSPIVKLRSYNATLNQFVETTLTDMVDGPDGSKSYTLTDIIGNENANRLTVEFAANLWSVNTAAIPSEGGKVEVTDESGRVLSDAEALQMPENSKVICRINPNNGWRIGEVKVKVGTGEAVSVGSVKTYVIENLTSNVTVEASFVKRTFSSAASIHTIVATAQGISDNQQSLHATQTYRFKLEGEGIAANYWTPWQSNPSYTFGLIPAETLKPNRLYTVTVQAQDAAPNASTTKTILTDNPSAEAEDERRANAAQVYTKVNLPTTLSVENSADENDIVKSVIIEVDPCDNPKNDTEYQVLQATSVNMTGYTVANLGPAYPNGWGKLDDLNRIQVYNLQANQHYWFQVIARNKNGESVQAMSENKVDIQLSPVAPPENSLWFSEQTTPGGPVKLEWTPVGDGVVEYFEIYRNGNLMQKVKGSVSSWTDNSVLGDGSYTYSYAYVNSAGVGSRRTAVSKAYKDATPTQKEALQKLVTDKGGVYSDVYGETMTFPVYPEVVAKSSAVPLNEDENSGQLSVYITTNGMSARNQKYWVTLQAYQKDPETKEEIPVEGWDRTKHVIETKSLTSRGAFAQWNNLYIDYDYRVVVEKIESTGAKNETADGGLLDGYGGNTTGIEYFFGKKMSVTSTGYTISCTDPQAAEALGITGEEIPWGTDESTGESLGVEYAEPSVWGEPIGDYMEFNKSPHIKLAEDPFGHHTNGSIETDENGNQVLVLDSNGDMTFGIDVLVWDPDGPMNATSSFSIKGTLGGVEGAYKGDTAVKTVPEEEKDAALYTITFDGKALSTGIYGDGTDTKKPEEMLTISISDGNTRASKLVTLPVVINRAKADIRVSTGGSSSKQIERGRNYGTEDQSYLKVITGLSTSAEKTDELRRIRLLVMKKEYTDLFGAFSISGIQAKLNSELAAPTSQVLAQVQKWMDSAAYEALVADNTFDETETKTVIDAMPLDVEAWFRITEDQYNQAIENGKKDGVDVFKQVTSSSTLYWAAKDYAFNNDLCQFLSRNSDQEIIVKNAETQTHPIRLTCSFGNNVSTTLASITLMDPPTISVNSNKMWQWKETVPEEYRVYKDSKSGTVDFSTVYTLYQRFQDCFDKAPWEQFPNDPTMAGVGTDPAPEEQAKTLPTYRSSLAGATGHPEQDGSGVTYEVMKLVDTEVTVGMKYMAGNLDVDAGVYKNITNVWARLYTDPTKGPAAGDTEDQIKTKELAADKSNQVYTAANNATLPSGRHTFTVNGLESGTTYYLWIFYTVTDPDSGVEERRCVQNYTALTTDSDYDISQYRFENTADSREETEDENKAGVLLNYSIRREAEDPSKSSAVINASIRYFKADQYGEYVLDETTNEPIEITPDMAEYEMAQRTLTLNTTSVTFPATKDSAGISQNLRLTLHDTDDKQGHMIAEVYLELDTQNCTGYNELNLNGKKLTIFVLDDDSHIETFIVGVDNVGEAGNENDKEKVVPIPASEVAENQASKTWKAGKYYDFTFRGISEMNSVPQILSLSFLNEGVSAVEGLTAQLYEQDQTTPSTTFDFTQLLTSGSLMAPDTEESRTDRVYCDVSALSSITDGVHTGWLCLTWNKMKETDTLWIRLNQVAYQSTLKGYIYSTPDKPSAESTQLMGKAEVTVYEYPGGTTLPLTKVLYHTTTDDTGYYEIPNILNGGRYSVVVTRPGFLTYSTHAITGRPTLNLVGKESASYELSIQLVGGDANGDDTINMEDYDILHTYYQHNYDPYHPEQADPNVVACDYNNDGLVNALDRQILWNNLNKTHRIYSKVAVQEILG